jgi:hypothetical protein
MHKDWRVVVVTPAGRRQYLELLVPQVLRYMRAGVVDEYHLWANTTNADDLAYMEALERKHAGRIRLLRPEIPMDGSLSIHHFFRRARDTGTLYVRFDDDIILLDSLRAFRSFLDFRLANRGHFLVYGNILNNAVCAHILQRQGKLSLAYGRAGYECMDAVGWRSPDFAKGLHGKVLARLATDGSLAAFRYSDQWLLHYHERVSINCLAWVGDDFDRLCGGEVGRDEEQELSVEMPKRLGLHNAIYGGFCVVHYAFYTQRQGLDADNFLDKYREAMGGAA